MIPTCRVPGRRRGRERGVVAGRLDLIGVGQENTFDHLIDELVGVVNDFLHDHFFLLNRCRAATESCAPDAMERRDRMSFQSMQSRTRTPMEDDSHDGG